MFQVADITPAQRDAILRTEEGHFHDLKAIDIAPGKLTQTISAFANAAGGELYVGVGEKVVDYAKQRFWTGFQDPEAANGHIQAFEQVLPFGADCSGIFLRCPGENGIVLQLLVNKTRAICKATDGVAYVRRGAQKIPYKTDEQLARLRLDKGLTSFETETVAVDPNTVTNSETIIRFLISVVPTAEPAVWLAKQQLLRDGKPTVAAVLLFADEPQAILPKRSAIKLFRYKTTEQEGSRDTLAFDPITIEGSLYELIKTAVERTIQIVQGVQVYSADGLETIRYPKETVHEIVTNAVLHRDYSHQTDIQIRVFDNRIEVESPGTLPGHVTPQNILKEQFARNGALVRLINKFPDPPNKDVGEGLNTAFEAMRGMRLKDPEILQLDSSVLVKIRHERLASPEEAILEYLDVNSQITNAIARSLTGIGSENKVKDVFYRLRDLGKIERVPGLRGSASAWRKSRGGSA
ncbi:ATP-binding protein [Sorangium cellulosum]|uniref:ATP-binding protein n=1 Tax=Sorangium cellulosum TaxID=56 RepID=UPI003D9A6E3F